MTVIGLVNKLNSVDKDKTLRVAMCGNGVSIEYVYRYNKAIHLKDVVYIGDYLPKGAEEIKCV
jgi:hypothetical protein